MNKAYILLSLTAAFTGGAVTSGIVLHMTMHQEISCVAANDTPQLPASLFATQPIPNRFKSY